MSMNTVANSDFADQYDTKENKYPANMVLMNSDEQCYWVCAEGHPFKKSPRVRDLESRGTKHRGCPTCRSEMAEVNKAKLQAGKASGRKGKCSAKTLAEKCPELVKEYHEKNPISAEEIRASSGDLVLWCCSKCGHEWKARVSNRTGSSKTGCPECFKKRRKAPYIRRW